MRKSLPLTILRQRLVDGFVGAATLREAFVAQTERVMLEASTSATHFRNIRGFHPGPVAITTFIDSSFGNLEMRILHEIHKARPCVPRSPLSQCWGSLLPDSMKEKFVRELMGR